MKPIPTFDENSLRPHVVVTTHWAGGTFHAEAASRVLTPAHCPRGHERPGDVCRDCPQVG